MRDSILTNEQILSILEGTPPGIAALYAGLPPAQLHISPEPGVEWSANEVLAHLRACADVWGSCINLILAQDRPVIRTVNPRTWIKSTDYLQQEFQPSLNAFAVQRAVLMKLLESLAPEGWSRTAIVTGAGKVLEWSVHTYAERLARHERAHLKQIEGILKRLRT